MNPQHDAAIAAWEHHNQDQATMPRDPIDVIGEGGSVIEADDIDTLKRVAQRLRDCVKAFPWSTTKQVEVATSIHVDANRLAEILHRIEGNR